MKPNDNELDKLIAEVLNEKMPIDLPRFAQSDNANEKAVKIRNKFLGNRNITGLSASSWLKLVGLDGNDKLSMVDIKLAFDEDPKFKKHLGKLANSPKLTRDERRIIKLLGAPEVNIKDLNLDADLKRMNPDQVIAYIEKQYQIYVARDEPEGVGTVDLPYRSVTTDKNWEDGDDLELKGKVPQATISVFRKGLQDAGGNLVKYFGNLQKLGDALALVGGSTDKQLTTGVWKDKAAAEIYLKQIKPDELFNTAVLLKTLAKLAKEVQGASAGTIFETYLSIMLGGAVYGGSGGAADVIAGKKGKRLFSAKAYQGAPGGSQAPGNFIKELGSDKKAVMWYIGLVKQGTKDAGATTITDFSRLDIHISGVSWNGEDNKKAKNYICYRLNGNKAEKIGFLRDSAEGWLITWYKEPDFKMPISTKWADRESIASFDRMFIKAIDEVKVPIQQAIKEMNRMLEDLQDQTKIYIADKGADSAMTIGDNYRNLKGAMTDGIGQIGSSQQQTDFKSKANLQENEINLDNLLDKLIQEVILTK